MSRQREIWRDGLAEVIGCALGALIPTVLASIGAFMQSRVAPAAALDEWTPDVDQVDVEDVDQVDVEDVDQVDVEDVDQVPEVDQ